MRNEKEGYVKSSSARHSRESFEFEYGFFYDSIIPLHSGWSRAEHTHMHRHSQSTLSAGQMLRNTSAVSKSFLGHDNIQFTRAADVHNGTGLWGGSERWGDNGIDGPLKSRVCQQKEKLSK